MEALAAQLEELECFESMFPDEGELVIDTTIKEAYEAYLACGDANARRPCSALSYVIQFKVSEM